MTKKNNKCSLCGKKITEDEMDVDIMGALMAPLLGEKSKFMPNAMQGLAMKCNRCGVWLCNKCAVRTATESKAGMISHSGCGGMFENQ